MCIAYYVAGKAVPIELLQQEKKMWLIEMTNAEKFKMRYGSQT